MRPWTRKERASPAFGSGVLVAVLLGSAALPSMGAPAGDSSPLDDPPPEQLLDCETEEAMLRREVVPVLMSGEYEQLPGHLRRRVNPFSEHPCGSLFDTAPSSIVFTSAHREPYEHSAIRALWSQVDAAWNARDAERFSRLFAEDVTFTFVQRRESLDGRATILEHFAERFPRFAPDLRHRTRISEIHAIAPGVFTADGNVEIRRIAAADNESPEVLRTFAIFAVMSAKDEVWRIRALRIYELSLAAAAEPDAGTLAASI